MALELFNTLSGKTEPLFASDGKTLRFYCCGPTVYDYGHIGNFRTFTWTCCAASSVICITSLCTTS